MSYTLNCKIKIGNVSFESVNEVRIKRSIFSIGDTAVIKLPLSAHLRNSATGEMKKVKTSQQFKVGDPVMIQLGYDGMLKKEFYGYVNRLNLRMPLEVECEDHTWPLKKINIKYAWKSATLREILTYIGDLAGFELLEGIPDVTLTNFYVNDQTALWALQKIKDTYGLTLYFTLDGLLYAGLAYTREAGSVRFTTGRNIIKSDDLKWVNSEDVRLKIRAVSMERNGSRIESELGDTDGEVRTLYFYDIHSKQELEELARAEIGKYKYTGYRGVMSCFLQPWAEPSMTALLNDELFRERSGNYFIESTEVIFGLNGARRKISLGAKLS